MRRIAFLFCAAALAGCTKSDTQAAADSAASAAPAAQVEAPAPAPISLADVAGKWNVTVTNEAGDSTLTAYVLTATADTSGWSFKFPKLAPIPMRVSVAGDSVMTVAGPFDSQVRPGTKVSTDGTFRLQDGKLTGTTMAHYKVSGPDSVRRLKFQGTRAK